MDTILIIEKARVLANLSFIEYKLYEKIIIKDGNLQYELSTL